MLIPPGEVERIVAKHLDCCLSSSEATRFGMCGEDCYRSLPNDSNGGSCALRNRMKAALAEISTAATAAHEKALAARNVEIVDLRARVAEVLDNMKKLVQAAATIDAAHEKVVAEKDALLREAAAMLKEHEYEAGYEEYCCPECCSMPHDSDCAYATLLLRIDRELAKEAL